MKKNSEFITYQVYIYLGDEVVPPVVVSVPNAGVRV